MHKLMAALLSAFTICSIPANAQTDSSRHFIIGFNPLHLTDDNIGFAVSYEYFFNSLGKLSLFLPVSLSFPSNRTPDDYHYYNYAALYYQYATLDVPRGMLYCYPGVKFYLNNSGKSASYAIGGSIVLGIGKQDHITSAYQFDTVSNNTPYPTYQRKLINETTDKWNRLKLGMMITNSLNLKPTRHLYLGVEIGLGYTYLNLVNNRNAYRDMLAQVGLKLGYYK